MICPVDGTQMHQVVEIDKEPITTIVRGRSVQQPTVRYLGGGMSTDKAYETWEIKECPSCGRRVREYYLCEVI